MLSLLPASLRLLIALFPWPVEQPVQNNRLTFHLRHEHGISNTTNKVVFADFPPSLTAMHSVAEVTTQRLKTHRPSSNIAFASARERGSNKRGRLECDALQWDEVETIGPDVESRSTLLALAKMTHNAYEEHENKLWYDLSPDWNTSYPFGWEPDADGFRGHVFVSTDNSTVVISIKGTSAGWMVGGTGPTVKKDKLNDNLLFSCCCARVGPTWSPVCDCYCGSHRCDQDCVEDSLTDESLFYAIGVNLYNNVTYMYPHASIWVIGHSLGGALASLIGATFGAPVVAFEAPAEKLAATRLHLPSPPSLLPITHVYHTADPIPMGVCNGLGSWCAVGGFAFETRCHLGKSIKYDTVSRRNWAVTIRTHRIDFIIEQLLNEDWELPIEGDEHGGRQVPEAEEERDCVDCFEWEFGGFKRRGKGVLGV